MNIDFDLTKDLFDNNENLRKENRELIESNENLKEELQECVKLVRLATKPIIISRIVVMNLQDARFT